MGGCGRAPDDPWCYFTVYIFIIILYFLSNHFGRCFSWATARIPCSVHVLNQVLLHPCGQILVWAEGVQCYPQIRQPPKLLWSFLHFPALDSVQQGRFLCESLGHGYAHRKLFKMVLLVPPVTKITRNSQILCILYGMNILFSLQAGPGWFEATPTLLAMLDSASPRGEDISELPDLCFWFSAGLRFSDCVPGGHRALVKALGMVYPVAVRCEVPSQWVFGSLVSSGWH